MNWKKFLEKKGDIYRADNAKCISIDNLKEFFLGEVARIEKKINNLNNIECIVFNKLFEIELKAREVDRYKIIKEYEVQKEA